MHRFLLLPLALVFAHVQAQLSPIRLIEESELGRVDQTVIADLDGDGDQDVAMSSTLGVGWWPNDGQGGHAEMIWVDGSSFTGYNTMLTAADMDDDGDVDLIAQENYAAIYLYVNDGGGGFSAPQTLVAGDVDLRDMILAKLNGDQLPDLLISDYWSTEVLVYPNLGGGTLGSPVVISSTIDGVKELLVADVNGDGDGDVLFAAYGSGTAHLCLNQGSGSFATPVDLFAAPLGVSRLQAADLDGDTDLDLIIADGATTWYANDGTGSFGSPTTVAADPGVAAYDVAVGDLDGDGDLDLIPTTYEPVRTSWYANDGSGQFMNMGMINQAPVGLAALADMDGDLDADIVQTRRNAVWWANDGSGTMGMAHFICVSMEYLTDVQLTDMDGDGDPDVLAACTVEDRITVMHNDGTGQFTGGLIALTDTIESPLGIETGDIDADGDSDLVVRSSTLIHVYRNDGSGALVFAATVNGGSTVRDAKLGDVDGDGDLDLVAAEYSPSRIRLSINDGAGNFAAPTVITSTHVRAFDLGDADGDGDLDLLTCFGNSNTQFVWFTNLGNGQFFVLPNVLATISTSGGESAAVATDLDMDGTTDLLFSGSNGLQFYRGLGSATFAAGAEIDGTHVGNAYLSAADLDADGDPDIQLADWSGTPARYYLNDGNGGFTAPLSFEPTWAAAVIMGDMDGDGDPDVLLGNKNGDNVYSTAWVENYFNSPYRIEGTLFHDVDENGVHDAGEGPLPFVVVHSTPSASVPLSNLDGSYSIFAEPGVYEVGVDLPNAWWALTTSPATYDVTLTDPDPVSSGNDFGYAAVVDTTVLEIVFAGDPSPCSDTTTYYIGITNLGTTLPSGTLCVTVNGPLGVSSFDPAPTSTNGGSYCWDIDPLNYYTPFVIQALIVNPDVTMIDSTVTALVVFDETDDLGNVVQTYSQDWSAIVACSYDPNDKRVEPAGYGEWGAVDIHTDRLEYTIRFQNTGNAPAENVVLVDRLDLDLDLSALQVLSYSHLPSSIHFENDRDLVVRFDGIQLPDSVSDFTGSQGFFRFAIGVQPGLASGTVITNTAEIYFDLNAPVITNTTMTTLVDCALATATITPLGDQALQATEDGTYQWFLDGVAINGATAQVYLPVVNGDYTVQVMSPFGCITLSDPMTVLTVAVADHPEESVAAVVYPDPFADRARILFSRPLDRNALIMMMDVTGKVVRQMHGQGTTSILLERGDLRPGLYMIRVASEGMRIATLRCVVE